jgi:hypothetical protein
LGALAAHPIERQFQERIRQQEEDLSKEEMKNEEENLRVHELDIYSHRESRLCTRQKIWPTNIYEVKD